MLCLIVRRRWTLNTLSIRGSRFVAVQSHSVSELLELSSSSVVSGIRGAGSGEKDPLSCRTLMQAFWAPLVSAGSWLRNIH